MSVFWWRTLCLLVLAWPVCADVESKSFQFRLINLKEDKPLLAFSTNYKTGKLVFLLDSGVEVPLISTNAAECLGLDLIYKPGDPQQRLGVVKKLELYLDSPDAKAAVTPLYLGPSFVKTMPIFQSEQFDGIFPPYLVYFGSCKTIDMANGSVQVSSDEQCKGQLARGGVIALSEIRSDSRLQFRQHKISLSYEGQALDFLIDTGSTLTYLDPSVVTELAVNETLIRYRKIDDVEKFARRPVNKNFSVGERNIVLKDLARIPVEKEYQAKGVVGSDFLSLGLLYYLGDGTGYFQFHNES